jgi:hypothetical protein
MKTPAAASTTGSAPGALLPSILVLLVLLLATTASLRPAMTPPRVVGADADATVFSAERARVHLREITYAPHPVGSVAHGVVRDYLVAALRALGLEPEIQQTTAVSDREGGMAAAVQNIVARVPGNAPTRGVLLMSHYDSAPHSYGAADAGNGVAAILETVRALQAGPSLSNDVIVLITDAEEGGLMGARAFVAEHPLAAEIGVVLNAEGRGNEGPVYVTRTSPEAGDLVRAVAGVPGAAANSLTAALLRLIPNDTDLSVFFQAGHAGIDMANGHGLTHYHTPLDRFDRADPRTLQHHGQYLLSLSRALGDRDLTSLTAPDRVYFTLPLLRIVHYPAAWALPLALLGVAAVVGSLAWGFRRRLLRVRGVLVGTLGWLAAIVALPGLAFVGWRLLRGVLPDVSPWPHGFEFGYDRTFYLTAFMAFGVAMFLALLGRLLRHATPAELLAMPLVTWAVLAVASAAALPGGSYLFTWPLLFAAVGMAVLLAERPAVTRRRTMLLAALAMAILLIVPQVVYMLEVMLTLNAVLLPVLLLALLLGLLVPQLEIVRRGLAWRASAGFAALATVMLVLGLSRAGFDADRPMPTAVAYLAHPDIGEAYWASFDGTPTAWSGQFLEPSPERRAMPEWGIRNEQWLTSAPLLTAAAPDVAVLASEVLGEDRRLRLRVSPAPGTWRTIVSLWDDGAARDVVVDGRAIPTADASPPGVPGTVVTLTGTPEQGFDVEFTIPAIVAQLRVRGITPGLPAIPDRAIQDTPAGLMVASEFTHLTRVVATGAEHSP